MTTIKPRPLPVPEVRELQGEEAAELWRESAHGDLPMDLKEEPQPREPAKTPTPG